MENIQGGSGQNPTIAVEHSSISELKRLFPNAVTSVKGSTVFAKQFTVLALSLITYTRGVFPAYAFSEKSFKGHSIKVLSGRRACNDAYLVTKWLKSSFAALEKGYMKELIFEILDSEAVLEYYSVLYEYKNNSIMCNMNTSKGIIVSFDEDPFQADISNLVSSILRCVKRLGPLPAAFKLQLRILYYDDNTPDNYIPDYFRECNQNEIRSYEQKQKLVKSLGRIDTPFHGIAMKIASNCVDGSDDQNHLLNEDCEPLALKKLTSEDLRKKAILNYYESNNSAKTKSPTANKSVSIHGTAAGATPKRAIKNVVVNCVCKMNFEKTGIFECFKCTEWHHLVCYKRKPTSTVNSTSRLTCIKCATDSHDSECLDPSLVAKKLPMTIIENLAVYRQAIFKLRWFALANVSTLKDDCHVTEGQAKMIIHKLLNKNLITPCTRSGDYSVQTVQLLEFINAYFR